MTLDFWIGVAITVFIGIVANLLTAPAGYTLKRLCLGIASKFHVLGQLGIELSIKESKKELAIFDDCNKDPNILNVMLLKQIIICIAVLWILIVTLGFAIFTKWEPSNIYSGMFFSSLGVITIWVIRLIIIQTTYEKLRNYEEHRKKLIRRIEVLSGKSY